MEEEVHAPRPGDLPTLGQLNRATAIAAAIAAMLLVLVVLPAEYGVDPTGAGRMLGLTEMGEAKRAAARAAAAEGTGTPAPEALAADADAEAAAPAGPERTGRVRVVIQPRQGTEVKATMTAGATFRYRWSTGGPVVHFELHGEPAGASGGDYLSYETGRSAGANGEFVAPVDGTHGWYWRNDTDAPVTINVEAIGDFSRFEQVVSAGSSDGD